MDAKYVAAILIFLSFSVFSFSGTERVEKVASASESWMQMPSLPACTDHHDLNPAPASEVFVPLEAEGTRATSEDVDAVEGVVWRISCLLASN